MLSFYHKKNTLVLIQRKMYQQVMAQIAVFEKKKKSNKKHATWHVYNSISITILCRKYQLPRHNGVYILLFLLIF